MTNFWKLSKHIFAQAGCMYCPEHWV